MIGTLLSKWGMNVFSSYGREILRELRLEVVMVDVGAEYRGIPKLHRIADFVTVYGFEPNPGEYARLLDGASGNPLRHRYKKRVYLPYAIDAFCGVEDLYVTRKATASSTLEPDYTRLREYRDPMLEDFEIVKTLRVEVRTLAQFARENSVDHIDYLKIDAESKSWEILHGAGDLLDGVSVIEAEVEFVPLRRSQKLFSDVDILLRPFGFELLNYEMVPTHARYKRRQLPVEVDMRAGIYGQRLLADAVYVKAGAPSGERAVVQAIVLAEKGYLDEALFILETRTELRHPEFFEALRTHPASGRSPVVNRLMRNRLARWLVRHAREFAL